MRTVPISVFYIDDQFGNTMTPYGDVDPFDMAKRMLGRLRMVELGRVVMSGSDPMVGCVQLADYRPTPTEDRK